MVLLFIVTLVAHTAQAGNGYPEPGEFARRIREALLQDLRVQSTLTYLERRRDVKISKLGKVTIGPLRTFEVFPSEDPGSTYKRLIEIDGKPLTPAEVAERDAEHRRNLQLDAERRRTETPQQRAGRLRKAEEERRHRDAMLEDAIAVFQATFVGRETVEGEQVLVADIKPREDARTRTREGRWMKQFGGRIWVDESDYQVVRLDMRALDDVTIGWGIIGRVHQGSRVFYARKRFNDVWLPAELTYEASGRTLLFRPFVVSVTTSYFGYKLRDDATR